ncbi:MAG: cupin domain-containing protein [Gammaproteobacteria bacterium]|nr:cupin domain-containing protein [Gammaproteobacteria bacterium]
MRTKPLRAADAEARKGQTIYPEPFARVVAGRTKRKLGDLFGLTTFGVNLTELEPGAASALFHWHAVQDEFIYVVEGTPTAVVGDDEYELAPGDCIGFKAGTGVAHQIVNRSNERASFLEIGDRLPGDHGEYPRDGMSFAFGPDGTPVIS